MFRKIGQVVVLLSLGWSAHAQKPTPPPKPPVSIPSISMCALHVESPRVLANDPVTGIRPPYQGLNGGQAFASRAMQGVCPTTVTAAGTPPTLTTDAIFGGWWAQCDRNPYLPLTVTIPCGTNPGQVACPAVTVAGVTGFCENAANVPTAVNSLCLATIGVKGTYFYKKIQTHGSSVQYTYSVTTNYNAVGGGYTGGADVQCTYWPAPTVGQTLKAGQTFRFLKCPIASVTHTPQLASSRPNNPYSITSATSPLANTRIAFWETVTITYTKGCYDIQWY